MHVKPWRNKILLFASTKDYIIYVENNMLPNGPITRADIIWGIDILGSNIGLLKGKMTQKIGKSNIYHMQ